MKRLVYIFLGSTLLLSCAGEQTDNIEDKDSVIVEEMVEPEQLGPSRIEFTAADGLIVSGLLYTIDASSQPVLLCHQAGFNLHEYDEIAPRLNDLGYNCIAIDQRSGGIMDGIVNETADRAIDAQLPMDYIAAEQDIAAAVDFTASKFNQPVILWGSSYSAGLALHMGQENENVKAVIVFSPGNYYGDKKQDLMITLKDFSKPFFITSSQREADDIAKMLKNRSTDSLHTQFYPETAGIHGSKVLWKEQSDNENYWNAIEAFLNKLN